MTIEETIKAAPPPPKECFCIVCAKTGKALSVFGNQQSATDWVRYLSGEVRVVRYVPVEENKEKETP